MRTKVRFQIGGLPVLAGAVLFLWPATASALDRERNPNDRPVHFKHHAPTHMTIPEAQQYERRIEGRVDSTEAQQTSPGFVPGGAASSLQPEMGSGRFRGIFAGSTTWDAQHDGTCQRQIQLGYGGSPARRWVHVTWMVLKIPGPFTDPSRQINYNCYKWSAPTGWTQGSDDFGGMTITPAGNRGGYCALDVSSAGNAIVGWHSAVEGGTAYSNVTRFLIPSLGVFVTDLLANPPGHTNIWPKLGISKLPNDVYHVIAEDSGPGAGDPATHCYWRYLTSSGTWQGPVLMDLTLIPAYLVLSNGNRVVYVLAKPRDLGANRDQYNNDLAYYESVTAGADWITNNGPTPWASGGGINVTNYEDSDPHRAWVDLAGGFDTQGRLHLIYTAPAYDQASGTVSVGPCILFHWDELYPGSNGIPGRAKVSPGGGGWDASDFSTVVYAMWGTPGQGDGCDGSPGRWNRYVAKPSLAFGNGYTTCDGSPNIDYLYTTYTQFGSENTLDKEDASAGGYQNGNIWMSISNDLGLSWAAGKCITTTDGVVGHTPTRSAGCEYPVDSCLSEHWSSCASLVNDTLHAFYEGDLDAGAVVYGEGNWIVNDLMYLPIFGGTNGPLCPTIAPVLNVTITSDPNCEYFSDLGKPFSSEMLTISNFGNATLTYGAKRVYINGSGWLALPAGDTITSTSIPLAGAPNTYTVDMDGSSLANGLYQAYIRVWHNDPAKTNPTLLSINYFRADSFFCGRGVVMTTPCVALEVSNVESWGRENGNGGMRYYAEPDDDSNFSPFFDGSLLIANKDSTKPGPTGDTVVYRDLFSNQTRSNPGFRGLEYLKLSYNAATNESVATANQVTVDSTVGVSVKYLFPQDADKCEFVRVKFRVYHTKYRNTGPLHLIIGAGADIDAPGADAQGIGSENIGGVIPKYNMVYQHGTDTVRTPSFHRETNKFVAGMTAITCTPVKRLKVGSNRNDVYPANGFKDGYIFQALNGTGNQIWADSADDIHSIISIKDITLDDKKAYVYQIGLVTSLAGQTGVKADAATYKSPYEGYVANLMSNAGKAWKKAFGWCGDFWMTGGHLNLVGTTDSIMFTATGTHENGLDGGCCGCNFTIVSVVPTPTSGTPVLHNFGDCTGSLVFNNTKPDNQSYTVTLRVADLCGAQTDEVTFVVHVPTGCDCGRIAGSNPTKMWADVSNDIAINPVDVVRMVNYVYKNQKTAIVAPPGVVYPNAPHDPPSWPMTCPYMLGDVNLDQHVDPMDVVRYVRYVYSGQTTVIHSNPCESQ